MGDHHKRMPLQLMERILISLTQKDTKLGHHFLIYLLLPTLPFLGTLLTLNLEDMVLNLNPRHVTATSCLVLLLGMLYLLSRPRRDIYLVDFACFKPPPTLMCPTERYLERSRQANIFTEESMVFQRKILERSGLGQSTYFPESILSVPSTACLGVAKKEAAVVMFGCVDEVLGKTGVGSEEVGIVIVNCSLFSPTPSLSAMVVNHYKLRSNVKSFNLGGMGCSAGLISIDLAKHLLQATPNTCALVVSLEVQTLNCYYGNDRAMLMSNCLFRLGGAAVLLSNRPADRRRSKYRLLRTVRSNKGADDNSYSCVCLKEDDTGAVGVALSRDLMGVAGEALKVNITTLGPLVLPISEQVMFFLSLVARKVFTCSGAKTKPYIPDFKKAFEHFCIHAGGKAVLDVIEKNLELGEWHMEPSRMTLYRFGNTSSSSLWYELGYTEGKGRVRRGDRVWQIAFGSGFKCNSAVWRALRNVDSGMEKNPWMDEIHQFPVPL